MIWTVKLLLGGFVLCFFFVELKNPSGESKMGYRAKISVKGSKTTPGGSVSWRFLGRPVKGREESPGDSAGFPCHNGREKIRKHTWRNCFLGVLKELWQRISEGKFMIRLYSVGCGE